MSLEKTIMGSDERDSYRIHVTERLGCTLVKIQWLERVGLRTVHGSARLHPDDRFDWKIGVGVALTRALKLVQGTTRAWRRAMRRGFYQAWPEAHPEYRVKRGWDLAAAEGDEVTRLTITRAACPRSVFDSNGKDVRIHCPSCITATGEALRVTKVETVPYEPPHPPVSPERVSAGEGHILCNFAGCACTCVGCRKPGCPCTCRGCRESCLARS